MNRLLTLFVVITFTCAVSSSALCTEFPSIVVVYDGSNEGLAKGVASILESASIGGEEFLVLTDPSLVSSMLSLPNIRCLVLTSVSSTDLKLLMEPVMSYFENGGSAIGMHGCCWQNQVGDLARSVFPAYGNSTGPGTRKDGLNVNEYVRGTRLDDIGDQLPESFDLVGQFFALARDTERNIVEPMPLIGQKTVLFTENRTGAALVIAYEGGSGARTITFTGLFLRDNPKTGNHYEKLLEQEEFHLLLVDAYRWVIGGSPRFDEYSQSYEQILDEREKAQTDLVSRAEEREASRKAGRISLLTVFWALGIACIGCLTYSSFVKSSQNSQVE